MFQSLPSYNKITKNIYIGNMWACKDAVADSKINIITPITHVISLIPQSKPIINYLEDNDVMYYEHSFADSMDENIIDHFNIMSKTIKKFLLENNAIVLFVCQAGKSRSVSIVILTLMEYYNMDFSDALDAISSKRETQINRRFYLDLLHYKKNKN